jgi:hypothetical protein
MQVVVEVVLFINHLVDCSFRKWWWRRRKRRMSHCRSTAGTANTGGGGVEVIMLLDWYRWRFRNSYHKIQISIIKTVIYTITIQ